jgi:phospholipid/cholesterol/gamma-HCH transport system ATP-binding protein
MRRNVRSCRGRFPPERDVTSVIVSHEILSAIRIAGRIIILFFGKIIAEGTPGEVKESRDPRVIQFIRGEPEGPIPLNRTDRDYYGNILLP